ncbi:MAG: Sugar phosphate isomerases/epimerase [uncultured Friedmanniella sp.]|uniref:Sugar phosphate isomerases/epimerase n=1 Tax=uncultured Friedmanniella sp. TaxID=335381 RepID=A0A6J4KS62_9ACTN|nr:sugar phosphate isomerase/epimerase family protein [uncultured Friedmanniella sp.]CAA9310147.1 MAG: Sugar phosphate isomerases/epimerase [uncultured Friedmanniella sp.]
MGVYDRLSLNTGTTKRLTLPEAIAATQRAGLSHIGLWRDRVAEVGLAAAAELVADSGLTVTSLCRGGFLTAAQPEARQAALADNRNAIVEAATLGTRELIMVVGGLVDGDKDLVAARQRVAAAIGELVPYAEQHGVRLVLEPLHPMYAADRAVLSTLEQALDLAAPHPTPTVGVVVDTFHVWWDPKLSEQIERAAREERLASYQICDFNLPIAADALLSRGMMGDGVIDFPSITRWVAAAGYHGPVEVEIFNADIWAADADEVLATMKERWSELVLPHLGPVPEPAG